MTDGAPSAPGTGAAPAGPRRMRITGVHHVTLIARDLGRTTAFWRDLLGLALVREGANDDDPGVRHFWFGDADGVLVSFLEYPAMSDGVVGAGSTHHLALGVDAAGEVDAWREYLTAHGVPCSEVFERGGLRSIYLRDPDGHILEITAAAQARASS